jgi:ABC-2 type transport system ATP-binding protein
VFISGGKVVADGTAEEVATRFGRDDLEGVFLHLAETSNAFPAADIEEAS